MTKKIPIEFGDYSKADWHRIWNILHKYENKMLTHKQAHMFMQDYLSQLDAATILYVVSRDGYELKRYL